MYRFVYLEDYFRHTFLSSCCLITEVIIVADSEEVNRFSEQFVCEFFNYPPLGWHAEACEPLAGGG